jgi:HEAT repeat protein
MPSSFTAALPALAVAAALGAAVAAQQPRIENGTVSTQATTAPLAETMGSIMRAQAAPAWIGYTIPSDKRNEMMCSYESGRTVIPSAVVKLEGSDRLVVMYRIAERRVDRVRVFSEDCRVDAGGLPVTWLENVRPADSVAFLTSLVSADGRDRVRNAAIMAISQHGDPSALETLLRLARSNTEPRVRGDALFWLAQRAGDKVAAAIRERIDQDPDTDVKKKAVFALSQLPKEEGVPLLIQVARTNRNADVRRQAMFWLGQSRDPRAVDFFAEILSK